MGERCRDTLMTWRRQRGRMEDECSAVAVLSWGWDTWGEWWEDVLRFGGDARVRNGGGRRWTMMMNWRISLRRKL